MPHIWVDADDILDELSEEELQAELDSRRKKSGKPPLYSERIPPQIACDALDDAARALRKIQRIDLAYKLDEIRHDYISEEL